MKVYKFGLEEANMKSCSIICLIIQPCERWGQKHHLHMNFNSHVKRCYEGLLKEMTPKKVSHYIIETLEKWKAIVCIHVSDQPS